MRKHLFFSGQVQGVGFRYTTLTISRGFSVSGFVRNLPDGRVELIAEGTAAELTSFLEELQREMGNQIREIDDVAEEETGEFSGFEIR